MLLYLCVFANQNIGLIAKQNIQKAYTRNSYEWTKTDWITDNKLFNKQIEKQKHLMSHFWRLLFFKIYV